LFHHRLLQIAFQVTVILVEDEEDHLDSCPLASVFCEICQKMHLRQDSESHITQNVFSHFTALAQKLKQTQNKVISLEQEAEKKSV
jgi:hypothetical protein